MEPHGAAATTSIDVAGLCLRVTATSEADLALVTRMIGATPADREADATIEIAPVAPALPPRPPDFEGPYGDHWDDGATHSFRHNWGLSAVVDSQHALLGGPATGYDRWVTVRNSMLFVLARLFFARGQFVVHGAAVHRDGVGILVVGPSGAGKSTLAYAAGCAGWSVLGDDMIVVQPGRDAVTVRGIPRVPSIPGDVARLTGASGVALPEDPRERVELVDQPIDRGEAEITALAVCDHAATSGSVTRVEAVTALHELVHAFVLADLTQPVRSWFPVAVRLAHGTCLRLQHAADLADRLAAAGPLLDEVARHCDADAPPGDAHAP